MFFDGIYGNWRECVERGSKIVISIFVVAVISALVIAYYHDMKKTVCSINRGALATED
jgi:hypothetical protein